MNNESQIYFEFLKKIGIHRKRNWVLLVFKNTDLFVTNNN